MFHEENKISTTWATCGNFSNPTNHIKSITSVNEARLWLCRQAGMGVSLWRGEEKRVIDKLRNVMAVEKHKKQSKFWTEWNLGDGTLNIGARDLGLPIIQLHLSFVPILLIYSRFSFWSRFFFIIHIHDVQMMKEECWGVTGFKPGRMFGLK